MRSFLKARVLVAIVALVEDVVRGDGETGGAARVECLGVNEPVVALVLVDAADGLSDARVERLLLRATRLERDDDLEEEGLGVGKHELDGVRNGL